LRLKVERKGRTVEVAPVAGMDLDRLREVVRGLLLQQAPLGNDNSPQSFATFKHGQRAKSVASESDTAGDPNVTRLQSVR
jgi:hypothetical protein